MGEALNIASDVRICVPTGGLCQGTINNMLGIMHTYGLYQTRI